MEKIVILIAEDDLTTQAIYRHILADEAFALSIAENGRDALRMFKELKPDIMVLDIMLPVMTGYSVLKEIRLQIGNRHTPILMATAISRKESVLDCIQLGIQGYIVKPLSPKDALQRILGCCEELYPKKTQAVRETLACRSA